MRKPTFIPDPKIYKFMRSVAHDYGVKVTYRACYKYLREHPKYTEKDLSNFIASLPLDSIVGGNV